MSGITPSSASSTTSSGSSASPASSRASGPSGSSGSPASSVTRREARWLTRRCGRKGHVVAYVDDPRLAPRLAAVGPGGPLLRCLRCAAFVDPSIGRTGDAPQVLGSAEAPVALSDLPLVLRGAYGRKLALLRLLAVERSIRGLLLMVAAAGLAQLASSHVAVAQWLGHAAGAAQPLGNVFGWDIARSHLLREANDLLGRSGGTFTLIAWLAAAYGTLEIIEGIGLWGGWRWAEYLTTVATAVFVPLEVYELWHRPTVLKSATLIVNVAAVVYLIVKGRLFATRGGHAAYLADVRDSTLLAAELVADGRPSSLLAGERLI